MNKLVSFFFLVFFVSALNAADYAYAYVVVYSDKNDSPFNIDEPEAFLSERAINRREKYSIDITAQDIPVNTTYIMQAAKLGGLFHNSSKWMNSAVFYTNDIDFASNAEALPFVEEVLLVYKGQSEFKSSKHKNKLEFNYVDAKSESIDYGSSENQITMCNAQKLHDKGFTGNGIHIAVIDAGFDRVDVLPCFEHLFENNQILGTYDFVDNKTNVYGSHSHGTSVMSLIAAQEPDVIYGSAPKASYYLLRSEDGATEFRIEEENWIAAAEYADSAGVDIITSSLGYSTMDDPDMSYSYEDMDGKTTRISQGAEIAFTKGMVIVNSAGNEGLRKLSAPSDGENVLGIGAVDDDGKIANFSSRGPSFDERVKPDVCGQGAPVPIMGVDSNVYYASGTSFSCPLIAGMIACLWQSNTTLSNHDIIRLMRKSGNKSNKPDIDYGYGIPNMSTAYLLANDISSINKSISSNFSVYPNPIANGFNMKLFTNANHQVSFKVYNMIGDQVYTNNSLVDPYSTINLSVSNTADWVPGLYLIVLNLGQEVYMQQIVKP